MSFALKSEQVVNELSRIRIVPVLVLNDVESGLKMCEILVECGLPAAEITFRTQAAEAIIKEAAKRFPDLYLGAGTILNVHDLKRAFDAGAKFAVAPDSIPRWCVPRSRVILHSRRESALPLKWSRRTSSAASS